MNLQSNSADGELPLSGTVNVGKGLKWQNRFKKAAIYFCAAFVILAVTTILFYVGKPLYGFFSDGAFARVFGVITVGSCVICAVILKIKNKLSAELLLWLIFLAGYFLRVCYMLYTPVSVRQHDTFNTSGTGHEAYARILFATGKLPQTNDYQFYHPPLNAFVQACFMHFTNALTKLLSGIFSEGIFPDLYLAGLPDVSKYKGVTEYGYYLFSTTQILAVLWSCITAFTLVKILKLFGLKGYTLAWVAAIVVFFPRHVQFSAQVNNDALAYTFQTIAIYYCLKWWKTGQNFFDLALCAVAIGLGMMAKISCATVAIPIASVFVYEFVRTLKKNEGAMPLWKMILHYGLFLVICAPLGLWFQVYAKEKFGQPFGFVFSNLNHKLYTGDHSVISRFFITLDPMEWFGTLYCQPFSFNYNLPLYLLRSSLFGEFVYLQGEGFAAAAFVSALAAVAVLVISLIYSAVKYYKCGKRTENSAEDKRNVFFVAVLTISQLLCEVYFYVQMPYACTMDFRYIMPVVLGLALTYYLETRSLKRYGTRCSSVLATAYSVSLAATLCFTTLFYLTCI